MSLPLLVHLGLAALLPAQTARAEATYRLPFEDGTTRPLTQGNRSGGSHTGYGDYAFDFGMPEGTKICAARGGKVVAAADDEPANGSQGKYGGMGNHVKIDHGDGTVGVYMHLKPKGLLVAAGDTVMQGDAIGLSGMTGNATGPHLHFQVDKGGKSIPIRFDEVESDGGVPQSGKSYTSRNTPGIPPETKDKLSALGRAARAAEQEGAYGLAYLALKRFSEEKLKVDYPPQAEARKKMDAIVGRAEEIARSGDPSALYRAKPAFEGVPTKAIAGAIEAVREDPAAKPAREAAVPWERFYRGLKDELEGRLVAARGRYKDALSGKPDADLEKRASARLAVVEQAIAELLKKGKR
jgi:hypothetical protein